MFSGIIEAIVSILNITAASDSKHFVIARPTSFTSLMIGESISVNGACLTVTHFDEHSFSVTAVPETLKCTNLDVCIIGDKVNIERAMRLDSRLGGHFVQGHIDMVGTVISCLPDDGLAYILKIEFPSTLARYIVPKGFIALDGMSVTIVEVTESWFTVSLIPHSLQVTISQYYQKNQLINIEVDMIAKYIEKMLGVYSHASHH